MLAAVLVTRSKYTVIRFEILHKVMLFQVPAQLPPEGGRAVYPAHPGHRGYGNTGGVSHALLAQPANMSQRSGHAQLRVSLLHLILSAFLSKLGIKSVDDQFVKYVFITYRTCQNLIMQEESSTC
jgi:hypothetical protein